MSFMDDIRDAREGYVRGDIGDALIAIESVLIGVAIGFLLYYKAGISVLQCIVIAIIVTAVIPWLVGTVPVVALIMGILFSLVWATVGFIVGCLIFDYSIIAGILAAVAVFAASFFCHKIFAGIGFVSSRKFMNDMLNDIRNNTKEQQTEIQAEEELSIEAEEAAVHFCSSCGAKLREEDVFCNKCGAKQS